MLVVSLSPSWSGREAALATQIATLVPTFEVRRHGTFIVASKRSQVCEGKLTLWLDVAGLSDRRRFTSVSALGLAERLGRDGTAALSDLAPPFRFAWIDGCEARFAADWPGLAHVFYWSGGGVAVAGTSSNLIAKLFNLNINTDALAPLALMGSMLGSETPISSVLKLTPGYLVCLKAGELALAPMPAASALSHGDDAVRSAVRNRLESFADVEVEVSGGLDSRLVVAALPISYRAALRGITIGLDNSPDVVTARRVCSAAGMAQLVLNPHLDDVDGDTLFRLLRDTARRDGYSSNPLDRASINRFNDSRPQAPRFSGMNGEILRGFYYPGQPLDKAPSDELAKRLIDWRVFSNDVVPRDLFDSDWYGTVKARTTATIQRMLVDGDGVWATRLDEFYLRQRMQRWCGISVSAAMDERVLIMPFFDGDVLNLASSLPATAKRGSRYVASLITRLDPVLAEIPTDAGVVARSLAQGGARAWLAGLTQSIDKVATKVRQRLINRDQPTFGSARAVQRFHELGLNRNIDFNALDKLAIFSRSRLEDIERGRLQPGRSELGFILNTHYLIEELAVSK